jgi:hypothetical protein
VKSATGYKIRNFRTLHLLADSNIEAKSSKAVKSTFLLEVYLHVENVPPAGKQHGERSYSILLALYKVCVVST